MFQLAAPTPAGGPAAGAVATGAQEQHHALGPSHGAPHGPPPPVPINKLSSASPHVKKDGRRNSSRFNASKNVELVRLPPIKGEDEDQRLRG